MGGPILVPLVDDHEVHVAEHSEHEDQLGDKLEEQVERLSELDGVESFETDAQNHLRHSQNDCYFHFHRVGEGYFVGGETPDGVLPERVHTVF